MNLLLDTHVAIWALNDDPALSEKARELILDPDNTIYYSTISVWEVLLKHSRRRCISFAHLQSYSLRSIVPSIPNMTRPPLSWSPSITS